MKSVQIGKNTENLKIYFLSQLFRIGSPVITMVLIKLSVNIPVGGGWGLFLRWWSPSTMWWVLYCFPSTTTGGCLNNPIFSNVGFYAACWAHFMCLHELWPTSASPPFSLNSSLGLAGGKHNQKITVPVFRLVLQNFALPGCFPCILFYSYLFSLISSGRFVIVLSGFISVQGTL